MWSMVGVMVYSFILPLSLPGLVVLACGWASNIDDLGVAECAVGLQHAIVVPVLR